MHTLLYIMDWIICIQVNSVNRCTVEHTYPSIVDTLGNVLISEVSSFRDSFVQFSLDLGS